MSNHTQEVIVIGDNFRSYSSQGTRLFMFMFVEIIIIILQPILAQAHS